jgi:hypothetical protein
MRVVATICSDPKHAGPDPLPASQLYLGKHIATVERMAREQGAPYFILSGKYGLLRSSHELRQYDYLLENEEAVINTKAEQAGIQMVDFGITEIDFYCKLKWKAYAAVMQKAAAGAGVELRVHNLPE